MALAVPERPEVRRPGVERPVVRRPGVEGPEVRRPGVEGPDVRRAHVEGPEAHGGVASPGARRAEEHGLLRTLRPGTRPSTSSWWAAQAQRDARPARPAVVARPTLRVAQHLVRLGDLPEARGGVGILWTGIRVDVHGKAPVGADDLLARGAASHLEAGVVVGVRVHVELRE
jgi:hypothetical protein